MSEKPHGIDFDRQVFVRPQGSTARPDSQIARLFITLAAIGAIAFLGYELVTRYARESADANDTAVVDLDKRLTAIEGRLEKLEVAKRAALPQKKDEPVQPAQAVSNSKPPVVKTVYQVSPAPPSRAGAVTAPTADPDPAVARRLSALQQGMGTLESDASSNREAWQATTNQLADMAGQVGSQGVEILKSQDELNQLLSRTAMEAIPFELQRGSNPQPVGPVSLGLKSANQKTQRYTVCVYVQSSCIELKDRSLHEVVQFVVSRNTTPLEVIATKVTKDVVLGYVEIPRSLISH